MGPRSSQQRLALRVPMAARRTAVITWCVFAACGSILLAAAAAVGPRIWPRVSDAGKSGAWVVFAFAVVLFLVSRIVPSRMRWSPETKPENIAMGRTAVATAMNGTIVLLAPLAWMVSGNAVALVAEGVSAAGLLLAIPTERRWRRLLDAAAAARRELAPRVAVPPTWTRGKVIAFAVLILLGGVAALVLAGRLFWAEEVLRDPSSVARDRALLAIVLASMMTAFATLRLKVAASSRHPLRERLHGLLLLACAAFLLVLVFVR